MEEKLKGVITKVMDNGNIGEINCGKNNKFTYTSEQLHAGYSPVLNDVVEFTLIEDQPFAITLYHRQKGAPTQSSSVDLKVKCPHCGQSIMPKAKVVEGKVKSTYCPKCNELLEKFEQPPKANFTNWVLGILIGILLTLLIYFLATGKL